MALRLPDPVRFDVYCFLKGLADAADVFPLLKSHDQTVPGSAACVDDTHAGSLDDYWREQEELAERIETGKMFIRLARESEVKKKGMVNVPAIKANTRHHLPLALPVALLVT